MLAPARAHSLEGVADVEWRDDLINRKCARCYQALTPPAVYRDGDWYHARCFTDGVRQLRHATRLAQVPAETPPYPSASSCPS